MVYRPDFSNCTRGRGFNYHTLPYSVNVGLLLVMHRIHKILFTKIRYIEKLELKIYEERLNLDEDDKTLLTGIEW